MDKITIQLNKPDRTPIGELYDVFSPDHSLKLGQVHKLKLTIPYYVERRHKQIVNPYFHQVKEKFQLKINYMNKTEWYVIDKIRNTGGDGKQKEIEAYSLPFELSGDKIYQFGGVLVNGEVRKESLTIGQVSNKVVEDTVWSIDYIDGDLTGVYRKFDFQNQTILQCLYTIAETYNAIIDFDTVNRTVNFYHIDNYGVNDGLFISYERYLKTINDEVDSQEIVTRLEPYGAEGITINEVNPTGSNYIQDFSYYISPFERDSSGNVIQSSSHLSDGLCHALLDYNDLIESKRVEYEGLVSDRDTYQQTITDKENAIYDKETELIQVQDDIQLKQSQGQDASTELATEDNLQSDIATLEDEKATAQTNLDNTLADMQAINDQLAESNNFTQSQLDELSIFINKEIWENENYSKTNELLEGARERLGKNSKPKAKIDIQLADLLRIAEADKDINKFNIGDKLYIHYEFFNIDVESQIIEMNINYETGSIDLVIANTKDIDREGDDDWFSTILYQNATTFGAVQQGKHKWDNINSVENDVTNLLDEKQEYVRREIVSGVNESVTINNQGITVKDSNDSQRFLRMTNSVIGMTQDGGNTFSLAIDPTGVYAERLIGRIIAGTKLTIENESGTYTMDDSGFTNVGNSGLNRVLINSADGIKIQKDNSGVWEDKFYADTNGVINGRGLIIRDENNNAIIDASSSSLNLNNVVNINGNLTASNIDATNLHVDAANIDGMVTAGRLRTEVGGTLVSDLYKDTAGGLLELYRDNGVAQVVLGIDKDIANGGALQIFTNTGSKAIEMFAYDDTSVHEIRMYDSGVSTASIMANGFKLYNTSSTLYLGGVYKDDNEDMGLELSESDGTQIFKVDTYTKPTYKGVELVTMDNQVAKWG